MPLYRLRIGDKVFERVLDWDSLVTLKDTVKQALPVVFDGETRTWMLNPSRLSLDPNGISRVSGELAPLLGVDKRELEEALLEAWRDTMSMRRVDVLYRVYRRGGVIEVRAGDRRLYSGIVDRIYRGLEEALPRDSYGNSVRYMKYFRETFAEGRVDYRETYYSTFSLDKEKLTVRMEPLVYVASGLDKYIEHLRSSGVQINMDFTLPDARRVLPDTVRLRVSLRDYQRRAVEAWMSSGRGVIAIPTGGGKTIVALEAIARLGARTLIVVPTINLAYQWAEAVKEKIGVPESMIGVLGGGLKELGKPVLISTYDSAYRHAVELGREYAFVIYDEGHHLPAKTFMQIARHSMARYVMVLSATPERHDGNHLMLYYMAGPTVYRINYEELRSMGYVSPVQIRIILVPIADEIEKEYAKLLGERARLKAELRRLYEVVYRSGDYSSYDQVRDALRRSGDERYKELNSKLNSVNARLRVLEGRNPEKNRLAVEIVSSNPDMKTFVFAEYQDQAKAIYDELAGRYGGRVALVTGKTRESERKRLFNAFRRGTIRVMVSTSVLDEGVDAPDAERAIIVSSRSIKHPRQFVQRIGRIVRPVEGKTSHIYILRSMGEAEGRVDELKSALAEVYDPEAIEVGNAWGVRRLHGGMAPRGRLVA